MLTREELLKTAALAGLEVREDEIPGLLRDMDQIVTFAARIAELSEEEEEKEAEEREETFCPLREDIPASSYDRALLLRGSCGEKDGFFCLCGKR